MNKREFLKASSTLAVGTIAASTLACGPGKKPDAIEEINKENAVKEDDFRLPELPYDYDALAPYIDARTMKIHHSKHHAGYVKKLNAAVKDTEYSSLTIEQILAKIDSDPKNDAIRNNAGGHYNHSLFWEIMTPKSTVPEGELFNVVEKSFGSLQDMNDEFRAAALSVFGSGWAWVCADKNKELFITATENQDNPMMNKVVEKNGRPILGIDVWEHAYYLKYKNQRNEYIDNFMNLINWKQVSKNFDKIAAI